MNLLDKDLQYVWHPCSQMKDYEQVPPIIVDHGKGIYLYDKDGNAYMDIISSWWCNLLGHCNPRLNQALKRQVDKLEHVIFSNFSHEPAILLCEQLMTVLPKGLCKFNFSDNGSAAVECALKMSFQYQYQSGNPQKQRFMALADGYHGETIGALSVGGLDLFSKIYKPLLLDIIRAEAPNCYRCPYGQERDTCQAPCFDSTELAFAQHGHEVAGFIIEPMLQGAAGMRMYSPVFLQKLRNACDRYGVLLIADEIASGYGRTGKMFACQHADISPDIMCISKGLTGGYMPMAITIATQQVFDAFYGEYSEGKAFMHNHTYSGNPLACSIALEVLNILAEEQILAQAAEKAVYLQQSLGNALINHPNVGEIRTMGLINAIELVANKESKQALNTSLRTGYQIYQQALKKGLILRPLGDVLYFNPPLNITEEEINQAVELCVQSIKTVLPE